MRAFLIGTVACILCIAPAAEAREHAVSIGGVSLLLPEPDGFIEPTSVVPLLRHRAEQLTAPSSTLLAVFVNGADVRLVQQHRAPTMERYFLVQARTMQTDVSPAEFESIKAQIRGKHQSILDNASDALRAHLDRVAREVGGSEGIEGLALKLGDIKVLGVFLESSSAIGLLAVTKVVALAGEQKLEVPMAFGSSFLLLKNRVIYFNVYSALRTEADLEWVRTQTAEWVRAANASN